MKKITAFVGSAHKKNTQEAVVQFLRNLEAQGDVENEIVTLSDYRLGICRGCRLCTKKGEEFCPLKDDRDVLMEKIDRVLAEHSQRFYTLLTKPGYGVPTLLKLMLFRISRTTMNQMLDDRNRDYLYYREMVWFESDYYNPTRLDLLKKVVGKLFDSWAPTLLKMIA